MCSAIEAILCSVCHRRNLLEGGKIVERDTLIASPSFAQRMCSAIEAILCSVCHRSVCADQIVLIRKTCRALRKIAKPSFYNSSLWERFGKVDSGPTKAHIGYPFSFMSYQTLSYRLG